MKFGVLYDFRNPPKSEWFQPWPEFYAGLFAHMQEMERLGFDTLSMAEHHGDPEGYNPGIAVTLTAAALHTRRIRICSNIIQLPLYHPVLLAEQLAVLDILSNGRLDVGIGQGAQPFAMELRMLGVNPKTRSSRLEEGLEILLRCWTEDQPFDFHGQHWDLTGVWLNPKPLQKPHPPTFVVAPFSAKAMDRVARFGLDVGGWGGFFTSLTGGEIWQRWRQNWRAACEQNGRSPTFAKINTFGSCFVTDDPEKAWATHRIGAFASFHYERQGVHPYTSVFLETMPQTPEDLPNWQRLFMTPEQAIAELRQVYADGAPGELHLMANRAGMSWEQSAEYLRNFAEKVIPAVKDL
jgi:alkanesulfonate monooxygenase SsuD/methylene tetrahydromethanopterin reductase-like flavin-dependent oxidoreductase (luciferase family)